MFNCYQRIITSLSIPTLVSLFIVAAGFTQTALAQSTNLLLQNSTNDALIIKPLVGNAFSQFNLEPGEKMVKDLGVSEFTEGKENLMVMMHMSNSCQIGGNCQPINCEMGLYTHDGRNINIRVYNGDALCAGYLRISAPPTFSS